MLGSFMAVSSVSFFRSYFLTWQLKCDRILYDFNITRGQDK